MINIDESGVTFGSFRKDAIYQIEESEYLPKNVKAVEFIWLAPKGNNLVLVEAKTSFSRPTNTQDFNENLQEIITKFTDSLIVLSSTRLGRHPNIFDELPINFKSIDWEKININFRLVIPAFPKEWLPPINDALKKLLKHFLASFGGSSSLQVINKEMAIEQRLVKAE